MHRHALLVVGLAIAALACPGGNTEPQQSTPLESCQDVSAAAECPDADVVLASCAWFPTRVVTLDASGACVDLMMDGGRCLETALDDGGCGYDAAPSCSDGVTTVFHRPAASGRELMLHDVGPSCDGYRGDFQACRYTPGDPPTYDPPECACGCPP